MIRMVDREANEQLWRFTDYSWKAYEDALRPGGDELLVRPAPGSGWPALRNALVHICWAYVRWLASPAETTEQEPPEVSSWEELNEYRRRVRGHARAYFDSLTDEQLLTPREMRVDGRPLRFSPGEILAHTMLHERQHHGDLNTLLYQHGLDIPLVEYRFSLPDRG
jgi:uncharacterized damage-inducible protein DinB